MSRHIPSSVGSHVVPLLLASLGWIALPAADSYRVEDIAFPPTVVPEVGGLGFTPEGELVVALRRYGILVAKPGTDPAAFAWQTFSPDILHNTCGLQVLSRREMIISTMDDLVRVRDTDGDGVADSYETICDDWGMSGNYHETNTIAPDGAQGERGWWLAIGTASHNGPVFTNVRGDYSPIGRRGRNFSAVRWKGWVVHVDPHGHLEPFASGFRANNGICVGPDGKLWVTDNQGDWRGTSPLYHVTKGGFYGHPSSLVWDPGFISDVDRDPLKHPLAKLDALRTRAAVELPQGFMCNSPSEPIFDRQGTFGPFAGQMFVGDVAGGRILRIMLDEVDGQMQGSCVKFVDQNLRAGNNRLVFSPDGTQLYTGQTMRGWGEPAEGLQRITYTGVTPFEVQQVTLTPTGFAVTFTKPVATVATSAICKAKSYYYKYVPQYGSPQMEITSLPVGPAALSADGRTATFAVEGMAIQRIVQLDFTVTAADGTKLAHPQVCYTLNRFRR